jgi:hypothetical protein
VWIEVKKAQSLLTAEMWKELFEGEGVPTRIYRHRMSRETRNWPAFRIMVPKDKQHVINEVLRKLECVSSIWAISCPLFSFLFYSFCPEALLIDKQLLAAIPLLPVGDKRQGSLWVLSRVRRSGTRNSGAGHNLMDIGNFSAPGMMVESLTSVMWYVVTVVSLLY